MNNSTSHLQLAIRPGAATDLRPRRSCRRLRPGRLLLAGLDLFKAELLAHSLIGLAVNLDVRIDEIVQRRAVLFGRERDVAPGGELDAVGVHAAKEIVFLLLGLPCLRDVHRNPSGPGGIKLSPAVIAGNVALVLVLGKREADVEARGNTVSAQHADKRRVEIGAVAVLGIAGPHRVSTAPTGARLIVAEGCKQVIVSSFGFGDAPCLTAGNLLGEDLDFAVGWDELVRLNEASHRRRYRARLAVLALQLRIIAARVLAARDLILQRELSRAGRRIADFRVHHVVAVFRLLRHLRLHGRFDAHQPDRLVLIGVRHRDPHADYFGARRDVLYGEGICEPEFARGWTELLLLRRG